MREIPVEVHEEAIAEAQAAREWYESRSPVAWSPYLHGTRRYLLRRFPFCVVYRKRDHDIQVVAVAHHMKEAGVLGESYRALMRV
jgi:hypothetical protein